MPDELLFYLVDAFAERAYQGNVAGVVLGADGLTDAQMQSIAREINASETAFVTRLNDLHNPPQVRWFTPTTEVDFCGHATLAATRALYEVGTLRHPTDRHPVAALFDSRAGQLRVEPETLPEPHTELVWWLHMPKPELTPDHTNPVKTCRLLGITSDDLEPSLPPMRTRDNDLIYPLHSWQTLMDMRPSFDELGQWCRQKNIRGICCMTTATLSAAINVHSRFFAPACGVNEDPVTGSVHGPLAVYLVVNDLVGHAGNRSAACCAQGGPSGRTGLVRTLVESQGDGYDVRVGGTCHVTLTGQLRIP